MEGQASSNLLSLINLLMEAQQNKPTLFSDEVNRVLSEIFEGQARKDFLWIADMLEYELSPLLRG